MITQGQMSDQIQDGGAHAGNIWAINRQNFHAKCMFRHICHSKYCGLQFKIKSETP